MWYIAIAVMLAISMYVGYRLTIIVDKRLSDDQQPENRAASAKDDQSSQE